MHVEEALVQDDAGDAMGCWGKVFGDAFPAPSGDTSPGMWPPARKATLPGSGTFVLGVSVGASLGATIDRYAADHDARGFEHLHVERDCENDPLDADEVRALAAHVVKRLNTLQSDGAPKHLLLRAPASLAVAIGLAANGTGPTCVPFYDGHDYYVGGIWIG